MSPRVTVLVAVKDGLPWLRDAVESVLSQTYADFELLLVDDGSTDGSADAAESYGDPRIRVLRNERNLGQVPSLNRGLHEARGEYVARLDADDVCLPGRLERQLALLESDPSVALVGTWMDVVDERGRLWGRLRGHVRDYPEFVFAVLADRYPWGHPSLMFRRDVVLRLGGYDEALAPAEDKDLYRRLALARHEARAIEEPLVRYRRHGQQLSQEEAEVQLRHDWESQERFLGELAGAEHAAVLRLLLATGPGREGVPADLVGRLLDGAQRRLELTAPERGKLESLLTAHLARRWRPLLPGARPFLRARQLAPLRRIARRSRFLRYLYSRLGAP
jgi:glycosyltransferase involved in cell wall biosynthesis